MSLKLTRLRTFAMLVLAEVYELDRALTFTVLAVFSTRLLLTLPVCLLLFGR
jgi:hypothetical protein